MLEDILHMYVMENPTKWKYYLHMIEFAYNNNYQASLKMCPFEVLYYRKCNIPIRWDNPIYRIMLGEYMLIDMQQMESKVKNNQRTTHDRYKSCANLK